MPTEQSTDIAQNPFLNYDLGKMYNAISPCFEKEKWNDPIDAKLYLANWFVKSKKVINTTELELMLRSLTHSITDCDTGVRVSEIITSIMLGSGTEHFRDGEFVDAVTSFFKEWCRLTSCKKIYHNRFREFIAMMYISTPNSSVMVKCQEIYDDRKIACIDEISDRKEMISLEMFGYYSFDRERLQAKTVTPIGVLFEKAWMTQTEQAIHWAEDHQRISIRDAYERIKEVCAHGKISDYRREWFDRVHAEITAGFTAELLDPNATIEQLIANIHTAHFKYMYEVYSTLMERLVEQFEIKGVTTFDETFPDADKRIARGEDGWG